MTEVEIKAAFETAKTMMEVITISNGLKNNGADVMLVNKCTKEARERILVRREEVNTIKRVQIPTVGAQSYVCISFDVNSMNRPFLTFNPEKGVTL